MNKAIVLLSLSMLAVTQIFGQFTLQAEFRPRFEYRGGYGKILSNEQKPLLTISQRSRLSAYYKTGIASFGLSIQDVRVWGDNDSYSYTGVTGSKSSIDLNEAWLAIEPYKNGLIKIGRQYWMYEDERLLGARGWNQSQVKYDALLFRHQQDKFQFDLGLSWNNMSEKLFNSEYMTAKMKSLNFMYAKKALTDWLNLSALAVASGFSESDTSTGINWQGTYGGYINFKNEHVNVLASGFFQGGKNRKGLKTKAYMFAINGEYWVKRMFSAGAGIEYLSGHNQKNSDPGYQDMGHVFDNLYGVRHRVFGHMDLFNNLPGSTANGGLIDIVLRLKYKPLDHVTIGTDIHFFRLENNVAKTEPLAAVYLDRNLGQEVDLNLSWELNKILSISGGYSFYLVTTSMEYLQGIESNGSRFPSWAWVMITAKPVFMIDSLK